MTHRRRVLLIAVLGLSVGPVSWGLDSPGHPDAAAIALRVAHRPRAPQGIGYSTDVHPIWSLQGCTSCHTGGVLDLTGSASTVYPRVIARVNLGNPTASLILTKPQPGTVAHGGGDFACFNPGSSCYDTILEWIQAGAPFAPCTYSINPTSRNHGAGGGSNSVAVTAGTGCDWTASEKLSWVNITAGASGSGNGTVSYSVSANASTSARSGTIAIAGKTFTINQSGAACSYSINPTSRNHSAAAGSATVAVTTTSGCTWNTSESLPWLSITAGGSGTGNGTVTYAVTANASTSSRSGNVTIAGKTFTASQDGTAGGACVQDATTACVLNGRFRAVVRYRGAFDNAPADHNAFRKPVTGFANPNFETVFFYFNSPDNIEILLKMLDQGNTNGSGQPTIAVLFGSATPLRVELTITDTTNGSVKTYTSVFNSMRGATDFTAFVK